MFNAYDDRHCADCIHAKYKETFKEGHRMYVCGKHRAAVTDMTLVQSIIGCKGKDYEQSMSKGKLDNYKCDGQISVFDYLETLPCAFSGHTCNKKELWKVADTLDDLMCPHVCCRKCSTRLCGVRCNGSKEGDSEI